MDYRYIEQLLQRYFDCDTTPQEETILRAFFSQEEVPAALEPYRAMFAAEAHLASQRTSEDFAKRVMETIAPAEVKPVRISLVRRLLPLYKAVAGVAIILALGLAAQQGLERSDSTLDAGSKIVTTHSARVAGKELGALPTDLSATAADTLAAPTLAPHTGN